MADVEAWGSEHRISALSLAVHMTGKVTPMPSFNFLIFKMGP